MPLPELRIRTRIQFVPWIRICLILILILSSTFQVFFCRNFGHFLDEIYYLGSYSPCQFLNSVKFHGIRINYLDMKFRQSPYNFHLFSF